MADQRHADADAGFRQVVGQAYVQNLENANLFTLGNLLTEVTNPPRTYGVRVSYRY